MTDSALLPSGLFEKPDVYLVEFQGGKGSFASMTREAYFRSIFTDRGRIRPVSPENTVLDVEAMLTAHEALDTRPARINFIFHTAHCGSTLLSRALDLPGRTIACREPFPLRQLGVEAAGINSREKDKPDWSNRLKLTLALLGRRYSKVEIPIVKANIPVNFILPEVLDLLPDFRSVLLYSKLESFLVSALKLPVRRHWVTTVSQEVVGGIRSIEALSGFNPTGLSTPKVAATLWVAQIVKFHEALARFENVSTLESDRFFGHTEDALLHVARFLGIDINTNEISAIANSELFSRYSKNPTIQFNTHTRESVRARVLAEFGTEIDEGLQYGARLIDQCGISQEIPKPLL